MIEDYDMPAASFLNAPQFSKLGREEIALLVLETEHCPQVTRRVIEIVTTWDILPFTFLIRRDDRVQCIEIEMAMLTEEQGLALLRNLLRLLSVRSAQIIIPSDRKASTSVIAKL